MTIFSLVAGMLLFAGCAPGAVSFSPQQAAIRAATQQRGPNVVIDQSSIQVRQTVQVARSAFVLISYMQNDGDQKSDCVMVFQSEQNNIGAWSPSGGGGGCTSIDGGQAPPKAPVEFGSGTNGGSSPADPGSSYAYGLVNQPDIVKVRVTWEDGQQQEVGVINSSYLAVRAGETQAQKIEGLNANDDIVDGSEPVPAPGKW